MTLPIGGCPSTHGGPGYVRYWAESYWKDDKIICGGCGAEICDPYPTSWVMVDVPPQPKGVFRSLLWALKGFKTYRIPAWDGIRGEPPEALVKRRTIITED